MKLATYARQTAKRMQRRSVNAPAIITSYPKYEIASDKAGEFHNSSKIIRFLFGGNRAGKTEAGAYDMIDKMREFPGDIFWSGTQTQETAGMLWRKHKKYLADNEIETISYYSKGKGIPDFFRLRNGSEHYYKTYKQGPGVWASESVRHIHFDEDPCTVTPQGEEIFTEALKRIIDCGGTLAGTATPVLGKNWMYDRIFLKNMNNREDRDEDPNIDHWTISLLDNKFIPQERKDIAKGFMTADEIDRRFYGLFTSLQGAVFKEWNEDLNVVDFGPLPAGIEKIVALDLGMQHPTVALFMGLHNEKVYVWQEYYKKGLYLYQHAENILAIEQDMSYFKDHPDWRPYRPRVCDHDAQDRFELDRYGVHTIPAIKNVEEGVQIMGRLMMPDENGVPDLLVHPRCYELRRTIPLLHYKPIRAGSDEKEVIAKVDDDPPDACRYGVMHFKSRPALSLHGMTANANDIV